MRREEEGEEEGEESLAAIILTITEDDYAMGECTARHACAKILKNTSRTPKEHVRTLYIKDMHACSM